MGDVDVNKGHEKDARYQLMHVHQRTLIESFVTRQSALTVAGRINLRAHIPLLSGGEVGKGKVDTCVRCMSDAAAHAYVTRMHTTSMQSRSSHAQLHAQFHAQIDNLQLIDQPRDGDLRWQCD